MSVHVHACVRMCVCECERQRERWRNFKVSVIILTGSPDLSSPETSVLSPSFGLLAKGHGDWQEKFRSRRGHWFCDVNKRLGTWFDFP